MKHIVVVMIDDESKDLIDKMIEDGEFKNKSQAIESMIKTYSRMCRWNE